MRFHEQDIGKLAIGRRRDAGPLIDFGWVEEIENRKVLDFEQAIHGFDAKAPLAVEEVGNVSLLESSHLGESKTGKTAVLDTSEQFFSQIVLQSLEFHIVSVQNS